MKTKNTKARLKDIKAGVTLYVVHPVYGIEKLTVMDRPYMHNSVGSYFVKVRCEHSLGYNWSYTTDRSLKDMGITSTYNDYRTFFKFKHAEEWQKKWADDKGFQKRHAAHVSFCDDMYDYEYDFEDNLDDLEV